MTLLFTIIQIRVETLNLGFYPSMPRYWWRLWWWCCFFITCFIIRWKQFICISAHIDLKQSFLHAFLAMFHGSQILTNWSWNFFLKFIYFFTRTTPAKLHKLISLKSKPIYVLKLEIKFVLVYFLYFLQFWKQYNIYLNSFSIQKVIVMKNQQNRTNNLSSIFPQVKILLQPNLKRVLEIGLMILENRKQSGSRKSLNVLK